MTIVVRVEDAESEGQDTVWAILSPKAVSAVLGDAGCVPLSHTPSHESYNLGQGENTSTRSNSKCKGLR